MEPSFSLTLSSLTLVLALARPHFPIRARLHPGLGPVTAKETEKTIKDSRITLDQQCRSLVR